MSDYFKFYHDSALTQPVTAGNPVTTEHNADGSTGGVDRQLWLGSADETKVAQAASAPGTDPIVVAITDLDEENAHEPTVKKLALTQGGLAAATPGAPLNLGVDTIEGGVANAVSFWVRVTEGEQAVGNWTDLALATNELKITAV